MIGREFPQQTTVLGPPEGMTVDEVHTLPVRIDERQVISCWQPTDEEREASARGGPVYVGVLGSSMPPIWVAGTNPFEEGESR